MDEIIDDILLDLLETQQVNAQALQARLDDYGFMIVPIEDPTNLRYGADD